MSAPAKDAEKIVVSLKHHTAPWTVIHASSVDDLFDQALDLFPNEVGPALQKKNPDPSWIIAIMHNAYVNKQDAAIEHFAKNVVKEKLGGREVDEDEAEERPRRSRYRDEEPADEIAQRRNRRREEPEDDEPPRRRSYGDDADEPDNAEYCEHGKMVPRSGTSAKGPWSGWFCPLPREQKDEQCEPKFNKKKGGGGYNNRRY